MFAFNPNMLAANRRIGEGPNGVIYPYDQKQYDGEYVAKHITAKNIDDLLKVFNQIVVGKSCVHPAIVPIKGYDIRRVGESEFNVFILMPKMKKNLTSFIKDRKGQHVSEKEVFKQLHNLINGLLYLRNQGIAHQNIKSANILIDDNQNLRLSDVGVTPLTRRIANQAFTVQEFFQRNQELFAVDVRNRGIAIARLCLLEPDLEEIDKELDLDEIMGRMGKEYSPKLVEIIAKMISKNLLSSEEISIILEQSEKHSKNDAVLRTKSNFVNDFLKPNKLFILVFFICMLYIIFPFNFFVGIVSDNSSECYITNDNNLAAFASNKDANVHNLQASFVDSSK